MVEGLFSMSQVLQLYTAMPHQCFHRKKNARKWVFTESDFSSYVCLKDPLLHIGGEWAACFFRFCRFFALFRNGFVCFSCCETGVKHQNKPTKCVSVSRNKPKHKRNRLSCGLFRF